VIGGIAAKVALVAFFTFRFNFMADNSA